MTSLTSVRLSICIPVYNFGPFVGQTLDSILGQSGMGEGVEVLVVDGASTDNTEEVVGDRQTLAESSLREVAQAWRNRC